MIQKLGDMIAAETGENPYSKHKLPVAAAVLTQLVDDAHEQYRRTVAGDINTILSRIENAKAADVEFVSVSHDEMRRIIGCLQSYALAIDTKS